MFEWLKSHGFRSLSQAANAMWQCFGIYWGCPVRRCFYWDQFLQRMSSEHSPKDRTRPACAGQARPMPWLRCHHFGSLSCGICHTIRGWDCVNHCIIVYINSYVYIYNIYNIYIYRYLCGIYIYICMRYIYCLPPFTCFNIKNIRVCIYDLTMFNPMYG
jgi:hypothetical protein